MGQSIFRLKDHDLEARLGRLALAQVQALESALSKMSGSVTTANREPDHKSELPFFLLPLAELGFSAEQMIQLAERVPADFPFDHRNIYFDFRLNMWIKHIEPPTVVECLEEYLENAESESQALAYLNQQWQAFLDRHPSQSGFG